MRKIRIGTWLPGGGNLAFNKRTTMTNNAILTDLTFYYYYVAASEKGALFILI
jgi:hypothetical protein